MWIRYLLTALLAFGAINAFAGGYYGLWSARRSGGVARGLAAITVDWTVLIVAGTLLALAYRSERNKPQQ